MVNEYICNGCRKIFVEENEPHIIEKEWIHVEKEESTEIETKIRKVFYCEECYKENLKE